VTKTYPPSTIPTIAIQAPPNASGGAMIAPKMIKHHPPMKNAFAALKSGSSSGIVGRCTHSKALHSSSTAMDG
jgi:hypothetical protein